MAVSMTMAVTMATILAMIQPIGEHMAILCITAILVTMAMALLLMVSLLRLITTATMAMAMPNITKQTHPH